MSDLRIAAQQALEAMLNFPDDISDDIFESITALKAALAQQPEPAQEPVAVFDERMGQPVLLPGAPMLKDEQPLYTAPPQRPPLTVQDLQQALVDTGLIFPEAIDDAEGFDHGVTLERIDKLHLLLVGVGS